MAGETSCVRVETPRREFSGEVRPPRPARASAAFGARDALGGQSSRCVDAVERRIRRLAGRGVLAGGLAERVVRSFDVEHVVDDLKREAEVARVAVDRVDRASSSRQPGSRPSSRRRESARRSCARACLRGPASSNGRATPGTRPAAARSIACPPTMPAAPAARGEHGRCTQPLVARGSARRERGSRRRPRASTPKASVSRPSPARIARPSP